MSRPPRSRSTRFSMPVRPSGLTRWIVPFAGLAALIVLPLYGYKVHEKTDYTDFDVYYRAATRVKAGDWENVYTLRDGASPFRYAPITLPFWRPFAELPRDQARLLWYGLQYAFFLAAFFSIYAAMRRMQSPRAAVVASFSALFVLRFCLDCFTIGQVSSLLFLAYCASFYGWTLRRPGWASSCLLVPAVFKIGPGFMYPLFLKGRARERWRTCLSPVAALGATFFAATLWIGPGSRNRLLWAGWKEMVAQDSAYYDASHYGSQSIKSALLRLEVWGWIGPRVMTGLYLSLSLLVCGWILLFWLLRRPKGIQGRAFFFALGIFPYLWVMPETFKYSLTVLAIPVALILNTLLIDNHQKTKPKLNQNLNPPGIRDPLREPDPVRLLSPRRPRLSPFTRRLAIFSLIFGALTLSLPGLDIVGEFLFFGMQKASLPLLATFFLGWTIARLARHFSDPSAFSVRMAPVFQHQLPSPWNRIPAPAGLRISLIAPLPMEDDIQVDLNLAERVLREADQQLSRLTPGE